MYQVSQCDTEYCLSVITGCLVDCDQIQGHQEHGHNIAQDNLPMDVVQVRDDHVDNKGDYQEHLTDHSQRCKQIFIPLS